MMHSMIKTLLAIAAFSVSTLSQAASLSFSGEVDFLDDPDNLLSTLTLAN